MHLHDEYILEGLDNGWGTAHLRGRPERVQYQGCRENQGYHSGLQFLEFQEFLGFPPSH